MIHNFLNKYATVLAIVSSFVMMVSGVLIFFHIGESLLKNMHEWIGLVFVVAITLHIIKNLKPFTTAFAKMRTRVASVITVIIVILFITSASLNPGGGHPIKQFINLTTKAPISSLAPLIGISEDEMKGRFKLAGFDNMQKNQSIQEIADLYGVETGRIFKVLLTQK